MVEKHIIVIKIGSSVIMTPRNKIDEFRLNHIAQQISQLQNQGLGIILVISGAVRSALPYFTSTRVNSSYSLNLYESQKGWKSLLAGFGQAELISEIRKIFGIKSLKIAQILLQKSDVENLEKRNHLKDILNCYLDLRIIPVLNENDVVELNSFGGNDFLAAEIAKLIQVKQLLILSTREGSHYGVGGGKSKIEVCKFLARDNIQSFIANGKEKNAVINHVIMF